ncbi:MAG: (2Fe-2S)-binding protein, partial [Cycloclasticus sp.]|nr:(2Fe-2S)-binding protein [Cycloclasticus sp.]
MSDSISFVMDGEKVSAEPGETIWKVAQRLGTTIPHLCFNDKPGYRSDGNCRACMVEIDGERTLAASCCRTPTPDMVIHTQSERATKTRQLVMELLSTDLNRETLAGSDFENLAQSLHLQPSRFPKKSP